MFMASTVEDIIANKVLQECSQDIVDSIDVDLVILRLHSKGRLTTQDIKDISTSQAKKRQLYILGLADKGSAAFKDIVDVLNDTALQYKPHADLADKLSKHYQHLLSQHSNKQGKPQEDKAAVTKKRIEAAADDSERPCSDTGNDVDHFSGSEHSDDQSQLLPDGITEDVIQPKYQSSTSHVKQASKVNMRLGSSIDVEASTNTTRGYQPLMESSVSLSSFQITSDHMTCQTPSAVQVINDFNLSSHEARQS